jgi:fructokinase
LAGLLDSLMSRPDAGLEQHLRRAMAAGAAACEKSGFVPPAPYRVNELEAQVTLRNA